MSIDANIMIGITNDINQPHSAIEIIEVLLKNGWSITHNNRVSYLAAGDKDNSEWIFTDKINIHNLEAIIKEKENEKEVVGIVLTWDNTDIGGAVLFWPNNKISLGLDSNRQIISFQNDYTITDFQWYLQKILPPLNDVFGVEYFSCDEHV